MNDKDKLLAFIRDKDESKSLDLSYSDLREINIPGATLRNLNLTGANLSNANLQEVSLIDSNLNYSNLFNTNLTKTNLTNCSLINSKANNAIFTHSKMDKVIFGKTELFYSDFSYVDFTNVIFEKFHEMHSLIKGVNLSFSMLINLNFSFFNFEDVKLEGANIINCDFSHAQITNAFNFELKVEGDNHWNNKVILDKVDFSYSNLEKAIFSNTEFKNIKLIGSNLCETKWQNHELKVDLNGADLSGAEFVEMNLNVNFRSTKLNGTKFINCHFNNDIFDNVALDGAIYINDVIECSLNDYLDGSYKYPL
jgi:uncharacterized protein YjbI with pentapeptide repeats